MMNSNKRLNSRSRSGAKCNCNAFASLMIVVASSLFVISVFVFVAIAPHPDDSTAGPGTNSIIDQSSQNHKTLSQKLLKWLPRINSLHAAGNHPMFPNWTQEFWSPIDVDASYKDPQVILCKLNFKMYSETPHLYPMFREFVDKSLCRGNNRRIDTLHRLLKEMQQQRGEPGGRFLRPTAFVFHESRVGSTLVANTLASDPFAMVYSESAPGATGLLHCKSCSLEENIALFQKIVTVMGRSPIHEKLFFKFQSITSTKMHIALQV